MIPCVCPWEKPPSTYLLHSIYLEPKHLLLCKNITSKSLLQNIPSPVCICWDKCLADNIMVLRIANNSVTNM